MRKIIFSLSVSLDGCFEDSAGGFDWAVPDEELHRHFNDSESEVDTHLYGRRMYEVMTGYWPTSDQDPGAPPVVVEYGRIWRSKKKFVFSRTLEKAGWDVQLRRAVDPEEIREMKAQPGLHMSIGGPGLASAFTRLGLIDEYRLYVCPVAVGAGRPVFPDLAEKLRLRLVDTRRFGSGVVLLQYRLA